jgi:hypothetical protein
MHMIGQDHHGLDAKGMLGHHSVDGLSRQGDVGGMAQELSPVVGDEGEKVGCALGG